MYKRRSCLSKRQEGKVTLNSILYIDSSMVIMHWIYLFSIIATILLGREMNHINGIKNVLDDTKRHF